MLCVSFVLVYTFGTFYYKTTYTYICTYFISYVYYNKKKYKNMKVNIIKDDVTLESIIDDISTYKSLNEYMIATGITRQSIEGKFKISMTDYAEEINKKRYKRIIEDIKELYYENESVNSIYQNSNHSVHMIRKVIRENPDVFNKVKDELDDLKKGLKDLALSKLEALIRKGNVKAIMFAIEHFDKEILHAKNESTSINLIFDKQNEKIKPFTNKNEIPKRFNDFMNDLDIN